MKHKVRNIHFVGIGGSGMGGIAEVLVNQGYAVSGSGIGGNSVSGCMTFVKKITTSYLKHVPYCFCIFFWAPIFISSGHKLVS